MRWEGSCLSRLEGCGFPGPADADPGVRGEPAPLPEASPTAPLCAPLPSHLPRCISISSSCTGITARINFHIEYLGIQPMYILYKYFHLGGAQQAFPNKGHRSSSLTLRAPSPLDGQRFCGNSWLCVIPTAHFLPWQWAVGTERGHGAQKGGFVEGATSRRALSVPWSSPVDAAPAEPTQHMEHLSHGKNSRKMSERSTHCQPWLSGFCGIREMSGAEQGLFGEASGVPAARLAQRGPGPGRSRSCCAAPTAAPAHSQSSEPTATEGLQHQKPALCVHKALPWRGSVTLATGGGAENSKLHQTERTFDPRTYTAITFQQSLASPCDSQFIYCKTATTLGKDTVKKGF